MLIKNSKARCFTHPQPKKYSNTEYLAFVHSMAQYENNKKKRDKRGEGNLHQAHLKAYRYTQRPNREHVLRVVNHGIYTKSSKRDDRF